MSWSASSVLAAFLSEILVGAVEGTGEALGLSNAFLGIVLLASVGGVAEGISAVTMARKGRLRSVARHRAGSCILIAAVRGAGRWCLRVTSSDRIRLSCPSAPAASACCFLAVLIGALVASGGSGHWYKGVQLIAVYLMIGLLLYFVPL